MGGRMWFESEVGRGSTFHFTCAFETGKESATDAEARVNSIPAGLSVLIVDNNPANHLIVGEMLTNWRMKPTVADSAAAGLDALERARSARRPYSVVLLDAKMPGNEGFQILERIHRNPGLASAVIMMAPIERQKQDTERFRDLGAKQIVNKPVSQSDLLDAILSVVGASAVEKKLMRAPASALPGTSSRSLHILLAEDHVVNQKLAIRLLEKAGHRVTLAGTGREAVAAWEHQTVPEFDIVLMDIQMPEMDGMEATAAIRTLEKRSGRHVAILAMTAHAMRGDKERCLASGMDGYISKPIHPAALFDEIERCVAAQRGSKAMTNQPGTSSEQIDRASLLERVEGDQELLVEMVHLFQQDAPNLVAALKESLQRGDMEVLERSAHSLKGAAGNLSAQATAAAAMQLEKDAKNRDATAAKASFLEVERALNRLLPALAELCEGVTK